MLHKKLQHLEANVAELEKFRKQNPLEAVKSDTGKEWALRYGLLESIQIVIDISCHLVVDKNLGNADTYSECIELLGEFDYIDKNLVKILTGMAGLRNLLVHEYVDIDLSRLYQMLDRLSHFSRFVEAVRIKTD